MKSKPQDTPVMREVSLSDKFDVMEGTIFITGKQSLSRVPLLQRLLDERRGLRTAGYISGYRGSPLGTIDNELLKIGDRLKAANIVFQPGLNEDLAMTAVWGSQQLDFVPGRRFDGVRTAEDKVATGSTLLTEAVAVNAFRLMAYKDEYEVARLLSDPSFWGEIRRRFDGGSLKLHLAPPIVSGRDPASGRPRKMAFSAALLLPGLRLLARFKGLRGSMFDPFGWMRERKMERRLRDEYLATVEEILAKVDSSNIDAAIALASYPQEIRGYGPVKEKSIARVEPMAKALRLRFSERSRNKLTAVA